MRPAGGTGCGALRICMLRGPVPAPSARSLRHKRRQPSGEAGRGGTDGWAETVILPHVWWKASLRPNVACQQPGGQGGTSPGSPAPDMRHLARKAALITESPFPRYTPGVSTSGSLFCRLPQPMASDSGRASPSQSEGRQSPHLVQSGSDSQDEGSPGRITGLTPGPDATPPVTLAPTWTVRV